MSLLFCDSFDHYTVPTDILKKYENGALSSISGVAGRTGNCININGSTSWLAKTVGEISNYLIIGFGWYGVSGIAAQSVVTIADRLVPNIDIYRNADSTISIRRHSGSSAATVLVTSVSAPLGVDTWHYVEVKAKRDAVNGEVIVKVDGIEVINSTGLNTTAYQDNGPYTAIILPGNAAANAYGGGSSGHKRYDDLYICDDLLLVNTDFLGEVTIYPIYPDSDASPNQWTPDAGTDHYARVNEHDLDEDTSYLEDTSTSDEELFGFEDSPVAVGSVVGIQVNTVVRKTTPGGATYKHQLKQGSTQVQGEEQGFPSGSIYNDNTECFDTDPTDGVDWTFARVNSLVAGVKRNA